MKRILLFFLLWIILIPFKGKAQQNCSLSVHGTVEAVSCSGGMDGSIRLQVSGGTKPYTYYWSNGEERIDVFQLTEGTYTVTVRDQNGCVATEKFTVKSKITDALSLQVVQKSAGSGKYILHVVFDKGKKPYAMNIKKTSDGIMAPYYAYTGQPLTSGIYSLEAFTEAGCSAVVRVKIGDK